MYPKPHKESFHVFTNNFDDYSPTEREVRATAKAMKKDGYENIRIYHDTEWNSEDGIWEDGDCIYSLGEFPS